MCYSKRVLPVLRDGFERTVRYLRISLTDRCNYRCTYCMPEEGVDLSPKSEVLSFEEIERVAKIFLRLGVTQIRLTGGEPTVRRDLVVLVERLSALGFEDLAMTTNGERLAELAQPLRRAGLGRLNISLDSLSEKTFRTITRRGNLSAVLDGIEAARAAGFTSTKLNVVAMGGVNDDEIPALCRYAWDRDLIPRFIEFMPMSGGALFQSGTFLSAAQVRAHIEAEFGALVSASLAPAGAGPARYQQIRSGHYRDRRLGIISAVTEPFCETCNRVRISSVGKLHTCLALDDEVDLRTPLRAGASDEQLLALVSAAVRVKKEGHSFTSCGTGGPQRHMVAIGG